MNLITWYTQPTIRIISLLLAYTWCGDKHPNFRGHGKWFLEKHVTTYQMGVSKTANRQQGLTASMSYWSKCGRGGKKEETYSGKNVRVWYERPLMNCRLSYSTSVLCRPKQVAYAGVAYKMSLPYCAILFYHLILQASHIWVPSCRPVSFNCFGFTVKCKRWLIQFSTFFIHNVPFFIVVILHPLERSAHETQNSKLKAVFCYLRPWFWRCILMPILMPSFPRRAK